MMRLRITTDGRIHGLWDDSLALLALGPASVRRASYVEFDHRRQQWYVRLARPRSGWRRVLQLLLRRPCGEIVHWAGRREAALAWERAHLRLG